MHDPVAGTDALAPFIVGTNTGFAAAQLQVALLSRYRPQSSFARAIR